MNQNMTTTEIVEKALDTLGVEPYVNWEQNKALGLTQAQIYQYVCGVAAVVEFNQAKAQNRAPDILTAVNRIPQGDGAFRQRFLMVPTEAKKAQAPVDTEAARKRAAALEKEFGLVEE